MERMLLSTSALPLELSCRRVPLSRAGASPARTLYGWVSGRGDCKGTPIGINLSRQIRQEAGRSVGARVDDEGLGGPLWSPGGGVWSCSRKI